MQLDRKKVMRLLIILLTVLLVLSLLLLAGVLLKRCSGPAGSNTATVPDNVISNREDPQASSTGGTTADETESTAAGTESDPTQNSTASAQTGTTTASTQTGTTTAPTQTGTSNAPSAAVRPSEPERAETTISLHKYRQDDNIPFEVVNMFPGDSAGKNYGVAVSYQDSVTVCFHADIRPGYEKLAEVLKCRVKLLTTGEILYDGLMRDMPDAIEHKLYSAAPAQDTLYYEITGYLETSVGNDYQNKGLIADFRWWVEEEENLQPPKTGDDFPVAMFAVLAGSSLFLLLLLLNKRRKEVCADGK